MCTAITLIVITIVVTIFSAKKNGRQNKRDGYKNQENRETQIIR